MGMMKKLTVLDIGDKIAIKNADSECPDTYVGKVMDILDYWDMDIYLVEYFAEGETKTTSVCAEDIDLVKQKELYYAD